MKTEEIAEKIRTLAIAAGLNYVNIEDLSIVNNSVVLDRPMPLLMFQDDGETNDYNSSSVEKTIVLYVMNNDHESDRIETNEREHDFILKQRSVLRELYKQVISGLAIDDTDYIEIVRDIQVPLVERLSINGFIVYQSKITLRTKRDYCIE